MASTNNSWAEKTQRYAYPSEFIDSKKKGTAKHCYQYIKAFDGDWRSSGMVIFSNAVTEMEENEKMLQGKEDMNKYLPLINDSISHDEKKVMFRNFNLKPLNRGNKFMRVMTGKLSNINYDVRLNPLNPEAYEDIRLYEARVKAYHRIKNDVAQMGYNPAEKIVGEPEQDIPKDDLELEYKKANDKRNKYAMAMEMATDVVLKANKFKEKNNELNEDMWTHGAKAVHILTDQYGFPKIEKVDLKKLAVGYSNSKDFSDIVRIGCYDLMKIATIRNNVKGLTSVEGLYSTTDEMWEAISKKFENSYGNSTMLPNLNNNGLYPYQKDYDFNNVPVFTCYWYSTDKNYYSVKKTKAGNKAVFPKGYGYMDDLTEEEIEAKKKEGKDREVETIVNIYKCSWIVGTDLIFNYGLCNDIPRGAETWERPPLPIQVIAPSIKGGMVLSPFGMIKTDLEACSLLDIKLQYEFAQMMPSGAALNLDALNETSLGSGGMNFTPQQVFELWTQKNILVFSGKRIEGYGNGVLPIQELKARGGEHIIMYRNEIAARLLDIQNKLGENPASDSSPISAETAIGVANIMQQNNNNALQYIYDADKLFHKNIIRHVFLLLQEYVRKNDNSIIEKSLGKEIVDMIKDKNLPSLWSWGLELEVQPTQDEWNALYQQIDLYAREGLIDPIDTLKIREFKNFKNCIQYLELKMERKKREAQEANNANIQANAQVQQQTQQMAQQFEAQKLQLQNQTILQKAEMDMQTKLQSKEIDFKIKEMEQAEMRLTEKMKQFETTMRELEKMRMQLEMQEEMKEEKNEKEDD